MKAIYSPIRPYTRDAWIPRRMESYLSRYDVCADAMGDYFKEGMKILDYGCGPAIFTNFMSQRLNAFKYYGLEPNSEYGRTCIQTAMDYYGHDERVALGYIGDKLERQAINDVEVGLLLSIFTHLTIEQDEIICEKLLPIVHKGGVIVFTMIMGDSYNINYNPVYSLNNTYAVVYNTNQQVEYLAKKFNVVIDKTAEFWHRSKYLHSVYQMRNKCD